MGCDGGTIPKRDELVKVKKKPEVKDKQAELSFQWRCCTITQEALQPPVVACGLGRLYNKSAVIEGLLHRPLLPLCAKHIRSLKDIKDLNLTPNPEYDGNAEKPEGSIDSRAAPFICPVTGLEMSGKFRFVCLWTCGCVLSERALKELNTNICPKCQGNFASGDVIVLNGNESDLELMKIKMEERLAAQKAAKRAKKNLPEIPDEEVPAKKLKANIHAPSSSTISCPIEVNGSITSSKAAGNKLEEPTTLIDPKIKKMKADYSVAKDPKVTDVYKSLFTSHSSEKQQTRAHWITYNPFYN